MRSIRSSNRRNVPRTAAVLRKRASDAIGVFAVLTVAAMIATVAGCAEADRTVIQFEEPRIYVHTNWSPEKVMASLRTHGCVIEAGNPIMIRGVGDCHWTSATVCVQNDSLVANGTLVTSKAEGYRNVVIDRKGRVSIDVFLPFE